MCRVPITKMGIIPTKQTCKFYLTLVANENDVSMCISVIYKTRTRDTAKNSLISAMSLVYVVSTTFLIFQLNLKGKLKMI